MVITVVFTASVRRRSACGSLWSSRRRGGQLPDLVGHDAESPARFPGAGRLDGRVDGENWSAPRAPKRLEDGSYLLRFSFRAPQHMIDEVSPPGRMPCHRFAPLGHVRSPKRDAARLLRDFPRLDAHFRICREVASSSLKVVVTSLIAVACSFALVACWLAADWSSDDEERMGWTALLTCVVNERAMSVQRRRPTRRRAPAPTGWWPVSRPSSPRLLSCAATRVLALPEPSRSAGFGFAP